MNIGACERERNRERVSDCYEFVVAVGGKERESALGERWGLSFHSLSLSLSRSLSLFHSHLQGSMVFQYGITLERNPSGPYGIEC